MEIPCDLQGLVRCFGSGVELLENVGQEERGREEGRLILDIINDEVHEKDNLDTLAFLQRLGLVKGRDYLIRPLPVGYDGYTPTPILRVGSEESYFGFEDIRRLDCEKGRKILGLE